MSSTHPRPCASTRTRLPESAAHNSSARGLRGRLRFSRFSIAWVSIRKPLVTFPGRVLAEPVQHPDGEHTAGNRAGSREQQQAGLGWSAGGVRIHERVAEETACDETGE